MKMYWSDMYEIKEDPVSSTSKRRGKTLIKLTLKLEIGG
jgi:hypothetical protein